jgi:hypothetical protein
MLFKFFYIKCVVVQINWLLYETKFKHRLYAWNTAEKNCVKSNKQTKNSNNGGYQSDTKLIGENFEIRVT